MQEERSTQEERGGFKGGLRTCNYLAVWQTSLHLGFIKFQIQASVRFIKFQWIKYSCVHTDCICKRTYCYQQRSQFNAKPRQATWVQNKQLVLIKWLWNDGQYVTKVYLLFIWVGKSQTDVAEQSNQYAKTGSAINLNLLTFSYESNKQFKAETEYTVTQAIAAQVSPHFHSTS